MRLRFLFVITALFSINCSIVYGSVTETPQKTADQRDYKKNPLRALCFDGGGERGLLEILALNFIQESYLDNQNISEFADVFCGTSTGSILAAGLALGLPLSQLEKIYREEGKEIFRISWAKKIESMEGVRDERYDYTILVDKLNSVVGKDKRLSEVEKGLVIISLNVTTLKPAIFTSMAAKASPEEDKKLVPCIRASAAAPTYFEGVRADEVEICVPTTKQQKLEKQMLWDGGVIRNNGTSVLAGKIRRHFGIEALETAMVASFGTGRDPSIGFPYDPTIGLVKIAAPISSICMDGSSNASHAEACDLYGEGNYVRCQFTLTDKIALDSASDDDIRKMDDLFKAHVTHEKNRRQLHRIAKMLKPDIADFEVFEKSCL
ncbi:patatin-like phospholipase family protein [Candidatus Nucleicultrix amoebiphila]|jgi:hypothetical protein|uniref:PNPLA domain-containing protein n=1 Tax=Candidatus Nucleicultrix amoebiphila FS5 TaxID=1414854 RepID=A0A1W6N618_9PROT|nr:patatin-like phospholipase family protein [Candidatus Nucleicultrix amoebiphila]ARN85281.1 hypothetical protein GQ61_08260 [Candidatus Nucleicultrix amoebiphila FS5]